MPNDVRIIECDPEDMSETGVVATHILHLFSLEKEAGVDADTFLDALLSAWFTLTVTYGKAPRALQFMPSFTRHLESVVYGQFNINPDVRQ